MNSNLRGTLAFALDPILTRRLRIAANDSAARKVIWSNLHPDMITRKHSDVELSHLAGEICEELVPVLALHTEGRIRETLLHDSVQLYTVILSHSALQSEMNVRINRLSD